MNVAVSLSLVCIVPVSTIEIPPLPETGPTLRAIVDNSCFIGAYSVPTDENDRGVLGACSGWKKCEPGFYCVDGTKHPCPAGRYGESSGLAHAACDGPCPAGYFCPRQSSNRVEYACGGSGLYCPEGSGVPLHVRAGFYTVGGDSNDHKNMTRSNEKLCEAGYYCVGGVKRACPAGRYGSYTGMGLDSTGYETQGDRSNKCKAGYGIISTDSECEEAAESMKVGFVSPYSNKSHPSGCIYRHGNNQYNSLIFFNTYPFSQTELTQPHNPSVTGWESVCTIQLPCTGTCSAGFYCPSGSTSPRQVECNAGEPNDEVKQFCPEGSGKPSMLRLGGHLEEIYPNSHFALPSSGTLEELSQRKAEELCQSGHFCLNGLQFPCPAGRYGERRGELNPNCTGPCLEGYYCPPGSISSMERKCIGAHVYCPPSSSKPTRVAVGFFSVGNYEDEHTATRYGKIASNVPSIMTAQKICNAGTYCINGTQFQCPAGRYGATNGLSSSECSGPCEAGSYCPTSSVRKNQKNCTNPSVFCPTGSVRPLPVHTGYYSIGNKGYKLQGDLTNKCHPGYKEIRSSEVCREAALDLNSSFVSVLSDSSAPAGCVFKKLENTLFYNSHPTTPSLYPSRPEVYGWHQVCEIDGTLRTKEIHCEQGHWCSGGKRYECPSGRYGATLGLTTPSCSGQCAAGFYCPTASIEATQNQCGSANVYCPEGSSSPTHVLQGYHTVVTSRSETNASVFTPNVAALYTKEVALEIRPFFASCVNASNYTQCRNSWNPVREFVVVEDPDSTMNIRSAQVQCTPGYYCIEGIRYICPAGRYGSLYGETRPQCEGFAKAGYFTPPGSYSPTQYRCGERLQQAVYCPEGSVTPRLADIGFWTTSPNVKIRNSSTECDRTSTDTKSTTDQWGMPIMVKACKMYPHDELHFTLYNDDGDLFTRTAQVPCPPGSWCRDGHRFQHPPGRYGSAPNSVHPLGEGECTAGFYCKSGSTSPMQFACGDGNTDGAENIYCPAGSGSPTPVDSGYYTSLGWKYTSEVKQPFAKVQNLNVLYTREIFFTLEEYESWKGGRLDLGDVPFRANGISRDAEIRLSDGTWKIHFFDVAANPMKASSPKHGNTSMKYEQILCEIGHWCHKGVREACPKGRYGGERGLTTELCSGPCAPGYICPEGSYRQDQLECGHDHPDPTSVYCPSGDIDLALNPKDSRGSHLIDVNDKKSAANTGSWKYINVSKGYYTIGGEGITNKTRFAQRPCEDGHYCVKGRKIRCPAGRYGATWKLSSIECSGKCEAGYFCPPGSNSSTQKKCGDEEGIRSPCYNTPTGTVESTRRSGERRCEYSHDQKLAKRWPEQMEDYGNGWRTVHHFEDEWLSDGQPRHYHYHKSVHHRSRVKSSGLPASVFCPKGSSLPTNVRPGFYTIGGNETTNKTRIDEVPCETGYFCEQGMKFQCPPGRYGDRKGLTEEHCSGFCPAGYQCPWNTTTPKECPPGHYSSGGWAFCVACPRSKGTESHQTCRTGRKCCNM